MRRPAAAALGHNLLAILIGAAGGYLFSLANLPLAWMLGAMLATTAAAVAGLPVAITRPLRSTMIAVLGVLLGSAFRPEILAQLFHWAAGAAVVALYVCIGAAAVYAYFLRIGRFDPVTAFFASSPGGFGEMVIMGEAMGGDPRVISLAHTTRILVVVFLVPFWYRFVIGLDVPAAPPGGTIGAIAYQDLALLVAAGAVGWPVAALLRLPAPALLGPMVLSAAIHSAGFTDSRPPALLIIAAQLVIGASVGARFVGVDLRTFARVPVIAAGATAILIALAVVFTFLFANLIDVDYAALNLALAPGGLAEMTLIALALGIDTAFVSTMHIIRIALIYILSPIMVRLAKLRAR